MFAGCLGEPQFWDDPPSFDTAGLDTVLDELLPDRSQLIPAAFESAVAAQFVDRVERLLDPIPDPVSESTLPNSAFRKQITTERRAAREQLPTTHADHPPFEFAERFAAARYHAAVAVGTWAVVTTDGDPAAITDGTETIRSRVNQFGDTLPGIATCPAGGAAVYGSIERWLDVAERRTLTGSTTVRDEDDPLRAGRTVGQLERIQSQIEAGQYLQARYLETVDEPQPIDAALHTEVETLADDVEAWKQELYDREEDILFRVPDTEVFFDTQPVDENAPSLRLLSRAVRRTFEDIRFDPVVVEGYEPSHPATALCRTMLALARLSACEKLGTLIEAGEDLFPPDGATVDVARQEAIDSVANAAAADNPLRRWFATQMLPLFEKPEEILAAASATTREIVEAYTAYRWIQLFASETEAVVSTVSDGLGA